MFTTGKTREKSRTGDLTGHHRLRQSASRFLHFGLETFGPLILIFLLLLAMGCATPSLGRYREEHNIRIKVVYLDRESLHEEYEELSVLPAVVGRGEVRAFFNPKTNTLYCQKWDFKYCGHELHHATDGAWHFSDQ